MCQVFFQNYAAQLSDDTNQEPQLVFFRATQCTPVPPLFLSLNAGGTYDFTANNFVVGSLYVPFNYSVTLLSRHGRSLLVLGPNFIADCSTRFWPDGQASMLDDPVTLVKCERRDVWETVRREMCMGTLKTIGTFSIPAYAPQSSWCDNYMTTKFCVSQPNDPRCACVAEQQDLNAQANANGVTLPVTCFGYKCATSRSYRTSAMNDQPCSLTLCRQIITQTPGVINEGTFQIFCGGQFFNQKGETPSTMPAPDPTIIDVGASPTPFYTWVMLGVSGILFLMLVFLLFTPQARRLNQTDTTLKKIQSLAENETSTM